MERLLEARWNNDFSVWLRSEGGSKMKKIKLEDDDYGECGLL